MTNPNCKPLSDHLEALARAAALRCDDHAARQALYAIAERDHSRAVILASELYGNTIGWLWPDRDED